MLTSAPRAASAGLIAWLLTLTAALAGCQRDGAACSATQHDGCLAACDRGQIEACRWLGQGLGQSKNGVAAGAMLLERACHGGDGQACTLLAALPVEHSRGLAPAASAPAASAFTMPARSCPLPAASAPLAGPLAAPGAATPGAAATATPAATTPAAGAPAVLPVEAALPPGAGPEALDLARRCDRGEGVACTRLGDRYDEGLGVARSASRALDLHVLGCERSDVIGCRMAGRALARPGGDVKRAVEQLRRGCMGSDAASCSGLGDVALDGGHPTLTAAYGPAQLQRACTNAHPPACRRLASLLRDGALLPRDGDAAERIEARSLDLAGQGCKSGAAESCLLLGLWRERPGLLGEDPAAAARTTDRPSLEGAVEAYRAACQAGLPQGCTRASELLEPLGRAAEAAELWAQQDRTCQAGDGASCLEAVEHVSARPGEHRELLTKACEQHMARACVLIGRWLQGQPEPAPAAAAPLLERACRLGEPDGCEALLQSASLRGEARADATVDVCRRLGGGACVPVAAAVRAGGDGACADRLLARACLGLPDPSPGGCAAASEALAAVAPALAAEADRRACAGPAAAGPALAASCLRHARAQLAAGHDDEGTQAAGRACAAGSAAGCGVLAGRLRERRDAEGAQRAALRGCQGGDRASCELRFGALPAPPASASPSLPPWPGTGAP